MEKDVKKLVEAYEKFICGDAKIQKAIGAPGTTLSKSELEKQKFIDMYRSFKGHIIWYTTEVGPDVANKER